jgi:hypothetical protein
LCSENAHEQVTRVYITLSNVSLHLIHQSSLLPLYTILINVRFWFIV